MTIRGAATLTPGFGGNLGKVLPEHLAGMIGLPSVGDIFYVDPGKTGGVSGGGRSRDDAFVTVAEGLAAATADRDDVILITPSSSTGRTSEAVAIDWNKRRTHLIGSTSPLMSSPRAGMSFGSAVVSPCFTVSARSCIIKNITVAQFNDVNVLVNLTSDYLYFEGVHFAGIGNATTGDDTAARSVVMNGCGESVFNGCTFGVDTVMRTAANYTLEFAAGKNNSNNVFRGCNFSLIADADAPRHILTNESSVNRWALFDSCYFNCNSDVAAGTTQTDAFQLDTAGDVGGMPIFKDCVQVGHTGWAQDVTGMKILGAFSNATPLTSYGEAVNPTA